MLLFKENHSSHFSKPWFQKLEWFTVVLLLYFSNIISISVGETSQFKVLGIFILPPWTLHSNFQGVIKTPLEGLIKKWIHILSIFIAIIPTHLLCEMQENSNNRKWLTKRYLSRNPLKMWTNVWPIISITCGKKRQSFVCWKWEATNKMHHQKAHRNMK